MERLFSLTSRLVLVGVARILSEDPEEECQSGPDFQLEVGDTLGGMEVLEPFARGGMGVVYKARQIKLNRIVALKVIDGKLASTPEFSQRFEREARTLAVLNHPNVVQVFDFGNEDGLCYLAMEWVDGTSLREILAAGYLSPEHALRYVSQICDALEYAHAQGVVHRDIKPENILIDREGRLKIADFGIARMRGDLETGPEFVTQADQQLGTPQYMAPEQQKHTARVDHRADLYSLGVVFYEMLTGELPLGRFENPSQRVKVDVALDEVVLKTLENDPNQRYQRASEIKQALTTSRGQAPVKTAPERVAYKSRPRVVGFALASLICSLMSLFVLWEMTRSWTFDSAVPLADDRQFFDSGFHTVFLRPVSIASAALAWVFGLLALWKMRQEGNRCKGRVLALSSMIAPVSLLVVLVIGQVLPLALRSWVDHPSFPKSNLPGDLVAIILVLVPAVLLLLCLRSVVRRLRGYAFDPVRKFPVITGVVTIIGTMILGFATWEISREWGDARKHRFQMRQLLTVSDPRPLDLNALFHSNEKEADEWLNYVSSYYRLQNNLFGLERLKSLNHLDRYCCTWFDGEILSAWMPSSRRLIRGANPNNQEFRDWHGYLWIHGFRLEGSLLTVQYEFPLQGFHRPPPIGGFQRVEQDETEDLLEKERRIREDYGVEPDTLYQVEIPFKDLRQYQSRGMDKEFWQSAELVETD